MIDKTNPKDLAGNRKPPLSLIPPSALIGMALAFKEGARKYGAYNWRTTKVQSMIYLDAALRHISQKIDGEDIDPESGLDHLDCAMASLAVYKDAQETGNLIDTRPPKGVGGDLIRNIIDNKSKNNCIASFTQTYINAKNNLDITNETNKSYLKSLRKDLDDHLDMIYKQTYTKSGDEQHNISYITKDYIYQDFNKSKE